jgi:hypothetical protein
VLALGSRNNSAKIRHKCKENTTLQNAFKRLRSVTLYLPTIPSISYLFVAYLTTLSEAQTKCVE